MPEELRTSRHLLWQADGAREVLKARGLDVSLFYNAFSGVRVTGGRGGEHFSQSGSADLFLTLDVGKLGLRGAGTVLMLAKALHGRNINPAVGAVLDPVDDADGSDTYIDQLWYEHSFLSDRVHWRVGYLDQQTAVDRNAYANQEDSQFAATALDNQSPIVPVGVGLGTTLFLEPCRRFALVYTMSDAQGRTGRAGWDTAFDSQFHVLEANLKPGTDRLPGNYRVGVVYDPRDRVHFGSETETVHHDFGAYVSFDQKVFAEDADPRQGAGLFLRYGWRDDSVNRTSHFWSFGAEYDGPVTGRDLDVAGLGFWGVHESGLLSKTEDPGIDAEYGLEGYYRVQVTPWLQVTPDVQYLRNPSAQPSAHDAVVALLRGRITF